MLPADGINGCPSIDEDFSVWARLAQDLGSQNNLAISRI
jgi:hypothetical protein